MKKHIDEVKEKANESLWKSIASGNEEKYDCSVFMAKVALKNHRLNTHQMLLDALTKAHQRTDPITYGDEFMEELKAIEAASYVEVG